MRIESETSRSYKVHYLDVMVIYTAMSESRLKGDERKKMVGVLKIIGLYLTVSYVIANSTPSFNHKFGIIRAVTQRTQALVWW